MKKKGIPALILLVALGALAWYALAPGGSSADRALLDAARAGNASDAARLLAVGADPNARLVTPRWVRFKDGEPPADEESTPLHFAAEGDFVPVIAALIEKGADVNARNRFGNTPLMLAAGRLDPKAVKVLLEHGADAAATNQFGKTAADFATKRTVRPEDKALIKTLQDAVEQPVKH